MVCDVVCRSQGVFPRWIRVTVYIMTRLSANAEIGVPRGIRLKCLTECRVIVCLSISSHIPNTVIPAKAGILVRIKIPAFAGMTGWKRGRYDGGRQV